MAKRDDLKAELTKRGIQFDPEATNKELEALLKAAETGEETDVEEEDSSQGSEESNDDSEGAGDEPEAPKGKSIAEVVSDRGQVARVYSVKEHGKNFAKLAKEFADKRGFTVRVK